jgi:hypothetical protein
MSNDREKSITKTPVIAAFVNLEITSETLLSPCFGRQGRVRVGDAVGEFRNPNGVLAARYLKSTSQRSKRARRFESLLLRALFMPVTVNLYRLDIQLHARFSTLEIQRQQRRQNLLVRHGMTPPVSTEDRFVQTAVCEVEPRGTLVVEVGERALG